MPLPFILGAGAAMAGVAGVGKGIEGINKIKDANERLQSAESRHNSNIKNFERLSTSSSEKMDELARLEFEILGSFDKFSEAIEKIQNRPVFKEYEKEGVSIPKYDGEELRNASIGASVLLGSLSSATLGTAGGLIAAGATKSAVIAFGKASTGIAISELKGAALTKTTLAALGGGALKSAPFAGGVALGSTVLSATTLGVGILVGGLIFEATGTKLSKQSDEAYEQMRTAEKTINVACDYLLELEQLAQKYQTSLLEVRKVYEKSVSVLFNAVNDLKKYDWNEFNEDEKIATQNAVLLVGLLYKMCQVSLVIKSETENELNTINRKETRCTMDEAEELIEPLANEIVRQTEYSIDMEKEAGEFTTEQGKGFRVVGKEIYWKDIWSHLSGMSSDAKTLELYDCDIYTGYHKNDGTLRLNTGDTVIISNCRLHCGEIWYDYDIKCDEGSQLIVKDSIFNESKRFVKLLSNSKLVIQNCELIKVEDFMWTHDANNVDVLIEKSEIIYPYKGFVTVWGNSKTTIKECSILLSNRNSEGCIYVDDRLIMNNCYVYANEKADVYGRWLISYSTESVIRDCTFNNISLIMLLKHGRIYRCHFESCINIMEQVFEIESTIFNECAKITFSSNQAISEVSKVSNCIFNKCFELWQYGIKNASFYDSYFINIRGQFSDDGCFFGNCNFSDILVGEREYYSYYRPIFSTNREKLTFLDCTFTNIDVRRAYFIECCGSKDEKKLYLKNCEFNDCITRREDGLLIKDIIEEATYTKSYSSGGFTAYDTHLTGNTFNVAVYEDVYQNNCRALEEESNDTSFNNLNSAYLNRIIVENKIGTDKTLELLNWETQIEDVENHLRTK